MLDKIIPITLAVFAIIILLLVFAAVAFIAWKVVSKRRPTASSVGVDFSRALKREWSTKASLPVSTSKPTGETK